MHRIRTRHPGTTTPSASSHSIRNVCPTLRQRLVLRTVRKLRSGTKMPRDLDLRRARQVARIGTTKANSVENLLLGITRIRRRRAPLQRGERTQHVASTDDPYKPIVTDDQRMPYLEAIEHGDDVRERS